MDFRCKQFSLNHNLSTMKVGTDAILLASFVSAYLSEKKINKILDVGTGCGILSLCMAQIFENSDVTAIDVDEKSVLQAQDNFMLSAFQQRLHAQCISLQQYCTVNHDQYDLIISNPPFFTSSLHSPDARKNIARHNNTLSLQDFVLGCSKLLSNNGFVAVVLPEKEMNQITNLFAAVRLYPVITVNVFAKPNTILKRKICIFNNPMDDDTEMIVKNMYIRDENNEYTADYKQLTSRFLL